MIDKSKIALLVCVLGTLLTGCARLSISAGSVRLVGKAEPHASRLVGTFSGPGEVEPSTLRAYGFLAFRQIDAEDVGRAETFCQAFVSTIDSGIVTEKFPFQGKEMVTVWPIITTGDAIAARTLLQKGAGDSWPVVTGLSTTLPPCQLAVQKYDIGTSRDAIRIAKNAGFKLEGRRGPFAIEWSPANFWSTGQEFVVTVLDMSDANTRQEAQEMLWSWRDRIEVGPERWENAAPPCSWRNGLRSILMGEDRCSDR